MVILLLNERKLGLKLKLKEYSLRIASGCAVTVSAELYYKYCLLEELLKSGKVDIFKVFSELFMDEKFDRLAFIRAAKVIEDHCRTGGQNTNRPVPPEGIAWALLNQKPLPVPVLTMN